METHTLNSFLSPALPPCLIMSYMGASPIRSLQKPRHLPVLRGLRPLLSSVGSLRRARSSPVARAGDRSGECGATKDLRRKRRGAHRRGEGVFGCLDGGRDGEGM